jgi:hypothetical protein
VGSVIIHPKKYHVQAVAFTKERRHWQILDQSIEADQINSAVLGTAAQDV